MQNLAWRIPGTGEPGGLLSLGSHSQTLLKRLSSSSSKCKTLIEKQDSLLCKRMGKDWPKSLLGPKKTSDSPTRFALHMKYW